MVFNILLGDPANVPISQFCDPLSYKDCAFQPHLRCLHQWYYPLIVACDCIVSFISVSDIPLCNRHLLCLYSPPSGNSKCLGPGIFYYPPFPPCPSLNNLGFRAPHIHPIPYTFAFLTPSSFQRMCQNQLQP